MSINKINTKYKSQYYIKNIIAIIKKFRFIFITNALGYQYKQ